MPKRKWDDEQESIHPFPISSETTSECAESYSDTQPGATKRLKEFGGSGEAQQTCNSQPPKKKKRVCFDGVTVYYFHRSQGFTCVPSCGGTTLGMIRKHHKIKRLSVTEHEVEVATQREQASLAMQLPSLTPDTSPTATRDNQEGDECQSDSSLNKDAGNPALREDKDSGTRTEEEDDEEEDEEEEEEEEVEDGEVTPEEWNSHEPDDNYYLQPLGARERRALLKLSGVSVEGEEKVECQMIRSSRQTCGCDCKGECRPQTCVCAQNQIKCQVDRPSFPCGCSKGGCGNPAGRVEFNPVRVRTHYIHTMMRMKMEERCGEPGAVPSPTHIRFDGADSYCDASSSTEECSSPGEAEGSPEASYQTPIPSFHTFFYANGGERNRYQMGQHTGGYWHLDAARTYPPPTSHYSSTPHPPSHVYPQSSGTGIQQAYHPPSEYAGMTAEGYHHEANGSSADSGFLDNLSPPGTGDMEAPSSVEGTYLLSSLYQHQSQKRPHSLGSSDGTGESSELASSLKASICGATG